MLDFKIVHNRFENQIYDILKYEVQYYDNDDIILQNLVDRFNEYIELFYNKYKIKWGITKFKYGILIKVEFDYDPPFGFEFCIDLDLLKKQRYLV